MNLNHLAVFNAVAEEQSVTRGAEKLMISQPAISKQLKDLERSLGIRIFDRMPRGIRLTEAGELLAGYARQVVTLANDAERSLNELRGIERGSLSIGASATIGIYLLPDLLVRFRQRHPGVQLQLEILGSDSIPERLLDGSIDIALTEGALESRSLFSEVFMQDELVAIAPVNHPLARKRSVTAATLCREPFVVRETGSASKSLVERRLASRGLEVRPTMSLGSTEAIKRAVAAGVGVAVVSRLAVALELRARTLALIRVSDLSIRRPMHRVALRGRSQSRAVETFNRMLDEAVSKGIGRNAHPPDRRPPTGR